MVPGILAVMGACVLLAVYALYAAGAGAWIGIQWEEGSPAEAQLRRERKTCLLSAMLRVMLPADLFSLVVFVALADRLHGLFTGAMCALGTLRANPYGLPAVGVMLAGIVLSGVWLAVNRLDAGSPNAVLVRLKYLGLLPVALALGAQAALVVTFFLKLNPTLITSCCAAYFDERGAGIASDLAHLPPALMQPLFWGTLGATLVAGWRSARTRRGQKLPALLSAVMLPLGLAAILSFLSVAVYDLPTHHCPFCLLQWEYRGVGYLLYAGLLLGTVSGIATGVVCWCGDHAALGERAAQLAGRLQLWSLAGYSLLGLTAGWSLCPVGMARGGFGSDPNISLCQRFL